MSDVTENLRVAAEFHRRLRARLVDERSNLHATANAFEHRQRMDKSWDLRKEIHGIERAMKALDEVYLRFENESPT